MENSEEASTQAMEGKWIVFRLGDESYAVSIEHVMTIETMKPITRMPDTSKHVLGMINLRGDVFPIISLRERFGMPDREATDETRIIVLNVNGGLVGCIADAVSQVATFTSDMIQLPPLLMGDAAESFVSGIAKVEDQLFILVDHTKLGV